MKKATMETLVKYIDSNNVTDLFQIRDELNAELNKGKEKAEANRVLYADYHDKVIEALRIAGNYVSAQELADTTGIPRGKVIHGLTRIWDSEVKVDRSGKTNLYSLV